MIRRERTFEGIEVNYIYLYEKEQEHKAIADNITAIIRDIITFQSGPVKRIVDELDDIVKAEGKEVDIREGTSKAGVDNLPYFSKVFNVINQMLFSIKAEAVAARAIMRLKEGMKPVITFASTMGSFIEQMENEKGMPVGNGDIIRADFAEVLQRGLDGILRYTVTDVDGKKAYKKFELSEFSPDAQAEYLRISERIKTVSTGITISPIDIMLQKIKEAGYTVAEVTGRKYELQLNPKTHIGLVKTRNRLNTNDAFRLFNNNEADALLINQTGSTGASAHAVATDSVPKSEVKQRVMISIQAELDINKVMQMKGRVNRTGQIFKPIYDEVASMIPAELRLVMMGQQKLKSLDANTTSNQKQSSHLLNVPDFLNKYGDIVIGNYLSENPEIDELLGYPLRSKDDSEKMQVASAAHKVSGRVAILSTKMQGEFYDEIITRYNDYVQYLKQTGEYDLEMETLNLEAETVSVQTVKVGKEHFERLVETLLSLEPNYKEVKTIGKTNAGDRGRDFILTEKAFDTFGDQVDKIWLVQCKFSEKSISPKTIPDWVNRTVEHSVDGFWLITNNYLTPDLIDHLNDVPKNKHYKFETRVWQQNTFDIKLTTRPEVFKTGLFFET